MATLIGNALPWTLLMVGAATVISFVLGIVIGAWVGWKRGTWLDHLVPATSLLQSIPYFWLALVLVAVFSVQLRWLPIVGAYDVFDFPSGPEWSWEFVAQRALPRVPAGPDDRHLARSAAGCSGCAT